jgi:hypothetical protein
MNDKEWLKRIFAMPPATTIFGSGSKEQLHDDLGSLVIPNPSSGKGLLELVSSPVPTTVVLKTEFSEQVLDPQLSFAMSKLKSGRGASDDVFIIRPSWGPRTLQTDCTKQGCDRQFSGTISTLPTIKEVFEDVLAPLSTATPLENTRSSELSTGQIARTDVDCE